VPEYVIEIPHSREECPPPSDGAAPWTTYHGCRAGTHTSWTIAELASADDAWALVPDLLRDTARVVLVDRSEPPGSRQR
jgi:hypothetical protein